MVGLEQGRAQPGGPQVTRRRFCGVLSRGALGVTLMGGLPTLLAACGNDEPAQKAAPPKGSKPEGTAVVGDVIDFALTSTGWPGAFGFVTFRLHRGVVDGNDVFFIRTDASDDDYAGNEKLVYVPKLAALAKPRLSAAAYYFREGAADQPTVLSSEPGRNDFTPACRLHEVSWKGNSRVLKSVAEIDRARAAGDVAVKPTDIVVNLGVVKWSSGELAVDSDLKEYLGGGQLVEPPDVDAMKVTFKLHECYPNNRYIVVDHSIEPAAAMTNTNFAPKLHAAPKAGATGRTNVFMNGIKGTGPMGFQPSAFDFTAGDPQWSPYWDHYAYLWKKSARPRLLTSQTELFEARDAGELREFPGMPETKGEVFTVNCPVPVVAPNTFKA